jgi:protein O-GlcNAc transferase
LQGYGGDKVEDALRAEAERAGVAAARVVVSDVFPKVEEHAHKRLADVFVDTAPFSAHTTMTDALFAGLPAVTWPGAGQPSRVGAALVMAAGPGGCVVRTLEEYEEVLVRLVRRTAVRKELRGKLEETLKTGPGAKEGALWDMTAFQVAYEVGLRMMWEVSLEAGRSGGGALRHVLVNSRTRERVLREHGLW